jgi:flavodoxin
MKVIILYMSSRWMNTEKVAKAMAEFLNATLPEVD